jgi:hypothetical protein
VQCPLTLPSGSCPAPCSAPDGCCLHPPCSALRVLPARLFWQLPGPLLCPESMFCPSPPALLSSRLLRRFVMVHGEVDKSLQSGGTLRGALFWQVKAGAGCPCWPARESRACSLVHGTLTHAPCLLCVQWDGTTGARSSPSNFIRPVRMGLYYSTNCKPCSATPCTASGAMGRPAGWADG